MEAMKLHLPSALLASLLTLGGLSLLGLASAQDPVQEPAKEALNLGGPFDASDFDPGSMAAALQAAATGKEHKALATQVGLWDVATIMTLPGMARMETVATSQSEMVLGGRWLLERFSGEFMGAPFEGIQLMGYDRLSKQYVAYWFDTHCTWATRTTGQMEDQVMAMRGIMRDAFTPKGRPIRSTSTLNKNGDRIIEMFDNIPPMGEVKTMSMRYTRQED